MEINQFEQFRAIAECGSMRKAAEKLFLSQPTLSHNLRRLENELGCELFSRLRNKLQLTAYGELVLERTNAIDRDFKLMLSDLQEMKQREEATLHIGCYSLLASGFVMPPLVAELPESRFMVDNCSTAELREGLTDGRFDVLLATDASREKGFRWEKLYTETAYISVPENSPLAHYGVLHSEDLADAHFNIESGMPGYSDWYSYILDNAGVPAENIERIPFIDHLKTKDALPACNLITSLIMGFVRTSEARVIIELDEPFARRNIGLLYRPNAPEKARMFVKHAKASAGHAFSGNAFIPYFLFHDDKSNLHIKG